MSAGETRGGGGGKIRASAVASSPVALNFMHGGIPYPRTPCVYRGSGRSSIIRRPILPFEPHKKQKELFILKKNSKKEQNKKEGKFVLYFSKCAHHKKQRRWKQYTLELGGEKTQLKTAVDHL